ncbi:MAG: sulfate ABC transporter permease subunit CysW [Paracoccus sp. (in: a-proteobacteria)]|uniref:sulfate ABC transporter permease subunit CysW n=1 Tax=Paracoccus sp. TaxID=267 RepID=UPI0039E2E399
MFDSSLPEQPVPTPSPTPAARPRAGGWRPVTEESATVRRLLIGLALVGLALLVVAPLAVVFAEALAKGAGAAIASLAQPDARSAVWLTLLVAVIAVPVNAIFGIAAAWTITKFDFRGKAFLITLIDLPFSVSPVVAGLALVLLFGTNSLIGGWLVAAGFPIIFALPGIVLASVFVTFPFVARELIPVMIEQGRAEEEAALTLGASGWRVFRTVTLPNIKWALLYGVLLCNARAMGEFGAVAVVSGKIRGQTATMPITIEMMYNEYLSVAAFSLAAVLAALALVTLTLKTGLEWRHADQLAATRRH